VAWVFFNNNKNLGVRRCTRPAYGWPSLGRRGYTDTIVRDKDAIKKTSDILGVQYEGIIDDPTSDIRGNNELAGRGEYNRVGHTITTREQWTEKMTGLRAIIPGGFAYLRFAGQVRAGSRPRPPPWSFPNVVFHAECIRRRPWKMVSP
jgi:hypothetical protein